MKPLEHLTLIDQIGRKLQSQMTFRDIDVYLKAFGVDTDKNTSSVNSKWVYTKELLADETSETVLSIADDLGIPHKYTITTARNVVEATFWAPHHFRLFLSHVSSFKKILLISKRL